MDIISVRIEALKLVNRQDREAADILERAKVFEAYIVGDTDMKSVSAPRTGTPKK